MYRVKHNNLLADARDVSTRGFRDLAGVHLFTFGQETDDRKGNGIPPGTG